jgi:hypothetical protein
MKFRTVSHSGHAAVVIVDGDGKAFCGASWCGGECGLPALVTRYNGRELRAFGSHVACGPVFQSFRAFWTGEKVAADGDPASLVKMMWW